MPGKGIQLLKPVRPDAAEWNRKSVLYKGSCCRGGGKSLQGETRGRAREKSLTDTLPSSSINPFSCSHCWSSSLCPGKRRHFQNYKIQAFPHLRLQKAIFTGKIKDNADYRIKLSESNVVKERGWGEQKRRQSSKFYSVFWTGYITTMSCELIFSIKKICLQF